MRDLIIVGAGPAGLTAALYAARYKLDTSIIEKMAPGGQIILSETIENFPGFPGGINTHDLIERMEKQVGELGVNIETDEVSEIIANPQDNSYSIRTGGSLSQARCVIIASGASPKRLNVAGENRFVGRGVSYCATCDGPLFRDKDVMVIGGGNRAIEEALFLTSYARKVTIVHRRQQFRASGILEDKARANPKVNFILDSVVEEISGEGKVEEVGLKNVKTNSRVRLPCQGIFVFVGIEPNTAFIKNLLNVDEAGFIMTDQDLRTSCPGIFACGDCLKKSLYQVVTACAEGALAADSAHKYLLNQAK
ncbi:MAG: thioredoxin-disulfide reductase [Deltaproteobacteria bacterium]